MLFGPHKNLCIASLKRECVLHTYIAVSAFGSAVSQEVVEIVNTSDVHDFSQLLTEHIFADLDKYVLAMDKYMLAMDEYMLAMDEYMLAMDEYMLAMDEYMRLQ